MKRLKSKVFLTIFAILTVSLVGFIAVFNVQGYLEKQASIRSSLSMANGEGRVDQAGSRDGAPPEKPSGEEDAAVSQPLDEPAGRRERRHQPFRQRFIR